MFQIDKRNNHKNMRATFFALAMQTMQGKVKKFKNILKDEIFSESMSHKRNKPKEYTTQFHFLS